MSIIHKCFENLKPHFEGNGKLRLFFPVFEALESFICSTTDVTESGPHIRDSIDIKRVMILVVYAMIPCYLFGAYNIGYQSALATDVQRTWVMNMIFGFQYIFPIYLVTLVAGGLCEVLFAVIRKHEISEGFLVTSALIPLIVPPTIPLWQVALATAFGVVIGKEVFGGVGMNIFNPALLARVFIFFAFPISISGEKVWIAGPDGITGATALSIPASIVGANAVTALNQFTQFDYSWWNMFWGCIPGSIGETNKLLILIGALFLIFTKISSWRIVVGAILGLVGTSLITNMLAQYSTNTMLTLPPHYHLVMGGFLFGVAFMATEPVTATQTDAGRWIYGILIGILTVIIRSINPAYPEGTMLAILLMNAFAPLIDYFVIQSNIKRRLSRYAQ